MTFLRAARSDATREFWEAVAGDHAGAPAAMQELARGDNSVVCDPEEAAAALEWARAHPVWLEGQAAVWILTA